jgi:hypothetical protein
VKHGSVLTRLRSPRLPLLATIAAAIVFLTAAPAAAHTLSVTGTTTCGSTDHVVTWTIHNNETLPTRTLHLVTVTAEIGGMSYTVSGYSTDIAPGGSTTASTTVPGSVTGTIVITVDGKWADGFKNTATGSVDLLDPCVVTTTSTSTTTTSTTGVSTSTTTAIATTTTAGGPGVSVEGTTTTVGGVSDISAGPTTTAGGTASLPFTGSNDGTGAVVGVTALGLGLVLLAGAKRAGAFTRR